MYRIRTALRLVGAGLAAALLASCARHTPLDCMERVMYFESNRSSRDGMVAVGSVVMNRVESGQYPHSVCGVVGQRKQFAPGVMTRRMDLRTAPKLRDAAQSVLAGERHPLVGKAQFFHTATYRANYNNMHYVVTTGGNAFYERRPPALVTQRVPLPPIEGITGDRPRSRPDTTLISYPPEYAGGYAATAPSVQGLPQSVATANPLPKPPPRRPGAG